MFSFAIRWLRVCRRLPGFPANMLPATFFPPFCRLHVFPRLMLIDVFQRLHIFHQRLNKSRSLANFLNNYFSFPWQDCSQVCGHVHELS